MALIKCPKCGKEVSDKALKCPNCRHPIKSYPESKVKKTKFSKSILLLGIIVVAAIFGLFYQFESKKTENILEETNKNIQEIKNCIGNVNDGYKETIELFDFEGVITYSNTLSSLINHTNTATWNPNAGKDVEHIYNNMLLLYGEPDETGDSHWKWQKDGDEYRIVLQHGNLGWKIVIQKEQNKI